MPEPFAIGSGGLDKRRVTQCALSRICGFCGDSLGRPVAFVGSTLEAERNAFHAPPLHEGCVDAMLSAYQRVIEEEDRSGEWTVLTTSGFEFVRPARESVDRRPTFAPNSILASRGLRP